MRLVEPRLAEVTVIMVSFNTRDITLKALETLLQNAGDVAMHVVVWDNASHDGSADAIAERFPQLHLIRSEENLGFAQANNLVAEMVESEWMLLLNPDTETYPGMVENLLEFSKAHPEAGITGGRTVFPDGSLNIASCWNKLTIWSLFCSAFGLSRMFPDSPLFNHEGIGGWKRDSVRHVDIVVGCLFMIRKRVWDELGGFSPRYFMYGEESDMCLRAAARGYSPMVTPDAQIMHLVGASSKKREDKLIRLMRSKATLIRDHWNPMKIPVGIGLLWLWIAIRRFSAQFGRDEASATTWKSMWASRKTWLRGYQ